MSTEIPKPLWDTYEPKLPTSQFKPRETLIIVAEKNFFAAARRSQTSLRTSEVADGLHFVELTITQRKLVKGNYRPEDQYYGYFAKGSDGWDYTCQWNNYDDSSTNPYGNWKRHFEDGVHYMLDAGGNIAGWLVDKTEDFEGHFLNWEVTSVLSRFNAEHLPYLLVALNEKFPNTRLTVCDKEGISRDGKQYKHSDHGPYYAKSGCFCCQHLPDQVVTVFKDSELLSFESGTDGKPKVGLHPVATFDPEEPDLTEDRKVLGITEEKK